MSLLTKLGHVGLGALPEQEFFERRVGWYNPNYGVMSESLLEGLSALASGMIMPETVPLSVICAATDVFRVGMITGGNKIFYGNAALEIVWTAGKGVYLGIRDMARGVRRRVSERNKAERDSIYPGGDGY